MTNLAPTNSIHDRFLADHRELEELYTRLLSAFRVNDRDEVVGLWHKFDDQLSKHLEAEERLLIPAVSPAHPREARALLEEHRHIRSRLAEVGLGVFLHTVKLEGVRGFVEELRAHARHEEDVVYRWADGHSTEQEQGPLFAVPTGPVGTRDR